MTRDLSGVTAEDALDTVLAHMRDDGLNNVSSAEIANVSGYPRWLVDHILRVLETDSYVRREVVETIGQPGKTLWYLIDA